MSNCTGVVYGYVKYSDGSAISGATMDINWVQEAGTGPLRIGGDDKLQTYTPRVTTTRSGEYIIPYFWASTQVPGAIASVLGIHWAGSGADIASSANLHGNLDLSLDLRKLFGIIAAPLPSNVPGAAGTFLTFYTAATPELKGIGMLRRFASTAFISTELQGLYTRLDFALS